MVEETTAQGGRHGTRVRRGPASRRAQAVAHPELRSLVHRAIGEQWEPEICRYEKGIRLERELHRADLWCDLAAGLCLAHRTRDSYLGPVTTAYRAKLWQEFLAPCNKIGKFSLIQPQAKSEKPCKRIHS